MVRRIDLNKSAASDGLLLENSDVVGLFRQRGIFIDVCGLVVTSLSATAAVPLMALPLTNGEYCHLARSIEVCLSFPAIACMPLTLGSVILL